MSRTTRPAQEAIFATQFGARLREQRLEAGFSIDKFAAEMGVAPSTVEGWEGGNSLPNFYKGLKLVNFYLDRGVPLMAEIAVQFGLKAEACLRVARRA